MTNDRKESLDRRGMLLMVACCLLWGLNQIIVKVSIPHVGPMMQAGLRSAFAGVLVWLYMRHRRIPVFAPDRTTWPGILAGVLFAAEFCTLNPSLRYTDASRVILFLYLSPFVVALGMPLISRHERLRMPQIAGLLLAFAALAYTFDAPSKAALETRWLGDLLAICGGLFWGLTTLAVRATPLSGAAPERTLFFQLAFSAPLLLAGARLTGESWPTLTWPAALTVGFQSVVVASTSYLVWFWMLRHYPATKLSAFTFLTPMFGMLFGVLLLHEPASTAMVGGLAGVAAGIWLVNRPPGTRTAKR